VCQCGCGDTEIDKAYALPDGTVVAYDIYQGCKDCFSGPGVAVYLYPNRKSEWLRDVKIGKFKPDEYGGNGGMGISVGLFDVEDLKAEADELEGIENYADLSEWLDEFGLDLIQGAMRRFQKRIK
jgi:hypothetical protein